MYRFEPILKTLVWGSESWVLSGVPGSESVVAEGPEAGRTLSEVYGGEFPLLIKFIDARRDLSIQVHPDDALAAARHGCRGKSEMWYVIGADEGAHLYSGLTKEIAPDEYAGCVEDGSIIEALGDYEVKPGDVFFIPPGRIHSICGGCRLVEIQEASDITYRIYDYNRPGLDGKPRQLHTELAKDAIDYTVADDHRTHYDRRENASVELLKCEHFTTDLFELTDPLSCPAPGGGRWLTVVCAEGAGTVNGAALRAGEALLLTPDENHLDLVPSTPGFKLLTSYC